MKTLQFQLTTQSLLKTTLFSLAILFGFHSLFAQSQNQWPRVIQANGMKITLYQPQPESLKGNTLMLRSAVSVTEPGASNPVFGVIWASGQLYTDRDTRMATLNNFTITDERFPSDLSDDQVSAFKNIVEQTIPSWNLDMSMDQIAATLDTTAQQEQQAQAFDNNPPQIIYTTTPTMLVTIDGDPTMQPIDNSPLQRVANSPFLLVYNADEGRYFLNGNGLWYTSSSLTSGWQMAGRLPRPVEDLANNLEQSGDIPLRDTVNAKVIPQIIVSTTPAELIQSDGQANLVPIEGTDILYVANTEDNIFLDVNSQKYFTLLSGRWYNADHLEGPWGFVPPNQLPQEFARIPVGSPKDNVLASIAGTPQATDAVHDAMLPQTAAVDRKTTTTNIQYDGDPEFVKIDNTDDLYYSPNSSETVLRDGRRFYAVDNGVWFVADNPGGPWTVATSRPYDVVDIPPSCPAYNVRYVYVYDYTPDVVYVGYTPGYTNCFIYGPTVVYGTGYYYHPWYRRVYIPRPWTWGLNMAYNPWTGWSLGFSWNYGIPSGWFGWAWDPGIAWAPRWGSWWGPRAYRPPVFIPYNHYYGPRPVINHNVNVIINNYYSRQTIYRQNNNNRPGAHLLNTGGNIYVSRPGITSVRPARRLPDVTPVKSANGNVTGIRPDYSGNTNRNSTEKQPTGRPNENGNTGVVSPAPNTNRDIKVSPSTQPNNVYSDKQGNVYKYKGTQVQKYDQGRWSAPSNNNSSNNNNNNNNNNNRPAPVQEPQSTVRQQPRQTVQQPAPVQQRNRATDNANNFQHFQQDMSRMSRQPQAQPQPQRSTDNNSKKKH